MGRRRRGPCRPPDNRWSVRDGRYDAGDMLGRRPLVASLARIPFFAGLDADALERLADGMRTRRFRRGDIIFHAGDPGDALFIIVTGEVKIAVPSESGEEAILVTLGDGDVFGELAAPRRRARARRRPPPWRRPRRSCCHATGSAS